MVALSRLKATFEAWKSNFRGLSLTFWPKYENLGSRFAKEWHVVTAPPCEAHRATSKDVRTTVHSSKSNMGLRKMHWQGPPQSACPAHAGNLVLKREENKFFLRKWRGLEHRRMDRAIHWFLYNWTSSTLVLWILSEHSKPQPAWCALPLLLYSTQHLHPFTGCNQLRTFPFLNEDIVMDGLCQEHASLWHTLLVQKVFYSKLAAWKIWLPRKSSRVETERGWIICPLDRCSEDGFRSPAFFCGCWGSSPYYKPPCQVWQQELHSQLCGDHHDASQQSSPRQ